MNFHQEYSNCSQFIKRILMNFHQKYSNCSQFIKRIMKVIKISYGDYYIFNYIIIIAIFSIILFLYGFFPINYNKEIVAERKDIPKFIENTRIKTDEVYKPVVKKLIIMVIDALRYDFISGVNSIDNMPTTNRLLRNKAGCLYKVKVNPPTVTMPRIKAMTTGSVPNFIDIVLNLGAYEIKGDNILRQFKNYGHKINFYGDDTWLKLFPNIFHRYEGTTSFYVTDYIEVDNNVTRNLAEELKRKDWSIMILHYLGLDHIGHIDGPFSPLIKSKLQQMDEIIGGIESYILKWNKNNESTLFLVCGDHGMKNSGGHGGASLEETFVPLLAFGRSCINRKSPREEIAQIDIVPTLSVLLGTPLPSSNLGSVILNMLSELSFSQKLFVLYYNAVHLFYRYQKINGYQNSKTYKTYKNAIKLHAAWLNTNSHPNEMVHDIILMYESAIIDMKNTLINNLLEYDINAMTLAIIFLGHILYLSISTKRTKLISYKQFLSILVASYVIWTFLNHLLCSEAKSSQRLDIHFLFVTFLGYIILILNCYLCATHVILFNKLKDLQILLPIANIIHTLSLSSSSFVEEEHQTWYFYWITLMAYFTYDISKKTCKQKLSISPYISNISLLILMIGHRILRKLNSTGDKWAHLPDISSWLQNPNLNLGMTFILVFGLILLVWLDFTYEENTYKLVILILDCIITILIYLRHAVTNRVYKPSFYFNSRGTVEMNYFWAFIAIYLIHSTYRLTSTMRHNKKRFLSLSLFLILKKWVIISCVLQRPYNVILLPVQLIVSIIIYQLSNFYKNPRIKLYLYLWSGNVFYFYQGNSNSLATVDIAAGYVGLESYKPFITGIFLVVNTYSAPILSFLMYLYDHALQNPLMTSEVLLVLSKQYIFWRLLPVTYYTIITSFQRYHLFVWTVFSPKLLYEAMYCTVLFSVMFILQLHFIFCDWIKKRKKCL